MSRFGDDRPRTDPALKGPYKSPFGARTTFSHTL